jgi:hypothetical protein
MFTAASNLCMIVDFGNPNYPVVIKPAKSFLSQSVAVFVVLF